MLEKQVKLRIVFYISFGIIFIIAGLFLLFFFILSLSGMPKEYSILIGIMDSIIIGIGISMFFKRSRRIAIWPALFLVSTILLYIILYPYWLDRIIDNINIFSPESNVSEITNYKKHVWVGNKQDSYHLSEEKLEFFNDSTLTISSTSYFNMFDPFFPIEYCLSFLKQESVDTYKLKGDTLIKRIEPNGENDRYVYGIIVYSQGKLSYTDLFILDERNKRDPRLIVKKKNEVIKIKKRIDSINQK
jgi:hypothetical protein